jgi:hypothetical protein
MEACIHEIPYKLKVLRSMSSSTACNAQDRCAMMQKARKDVRINSTAFEEKLKGVF